MKPLVTVIIPCYNHEMFVQEAINSVIKQTYSNIELIIFNDGSKDGSHEQIVALSNACKSRFTHFRYINKLNEGIAETLNKGIALSSGTYLTFCASDDRYVDNCIETLVDKYMQLDNSIGMISGDTNFIDGIGQDIFFDRFNKIVHDRKVAKYRTLKEMTFNYDPTEFISGYGTYRHVITGRCGFIQASMFAKKAVIDVGMFDPNTRVEDLSLCLRIAKKYKVKYVNQVLFNYRIHGANSVLLQLTFLSKEIIRLLLHEKYYCIEHGLIREWENRCFGELNTILKHGELRFVVRFIKKESLVHKYGWNLAKTVLKKINNKVSWKLE